MVVSERLVVDCNQAPSYCIHRCTKIFLLAVIVDGNASLPRNSLVEFLKFLIKNN